MNVKHTGQYSYCEILAKIIKCNCKATNDKWGIKMVCELNDKIHFYRENLYELISSENLDSELVLKLSQELDKLILEYIKREL